VETALAATDPNIRTRLWTGHERRVTAWKPNRTSSRLLENHNRPVRTQLRVSATRDAQGLDASGRRQVLRGQTGSHGEPVLGLTLHEKRHEVSDWGLVESAVN
jgi:hypothetical protein